MLISIPGVHMGFGHRMRHLMGLYLRQLVGHIFGPPMGHQLTCVVQILDGCTKCFGRVTR